MSQLGVLSASFPWGVFQKIGQYFLSFLLTSTFITGIILYLILFPLVNFGISLVTGCLHGALFWEFYINLLTGICSMITDSRRSFGAVAGQGGNPNLGPSNLRSQILFQIGRILS